ncbi:FHA domain-containing serine/threonine-protein kinase [Calycomorphotria hydatis]|uniref:Serine/threonine-protein kinase PknB n=1 Tax=Calycomorphotria hydatis TaxID=2528027 RepID=A0A517T8M7_9PLAN|nr:FHA domain-containing serine/threonine-protein kinase [Calycomorphotria hydatis]QDT64709.1 Serine/threonine-protein kinase PknB [Calycomorphotria hydatis]
MIQISILQGPNEGRNHPIEPGQAILMGRGSNCQIKLDDSSVSRVHCQLEIKDGQVHLVDTNSSWGTLVNGSKVEERILHAGDKVQIGNTIFRIDDDEASTDQTLPPGASKSIIGNIKTEAEKPKAASSSSKSVRLAPNDWSGKTYLHYEVQDLISDSITGVTYAAQDTKANRKIALKLFRPEFLSQEVKQERFVRAMKTMIPLEHPNLIQVYNAGKKSGLCFTACEFVEGESAAQMIERIGISGMLDWRNVLQIAVHISRALEFAEEHQIVHRNITPKTILIRSIDKVAKLGDLFLAKSIDLEDENVVTQKGELVGELSYMAPEQLDSDKKIDCRADIYSLGATLYALLTGRPPFEGRNTVDTINKVLNDTPASPKATHLSIPDMMEGVVMKMLARSREERYQHPSNLLKDLERTAMFNALTID